MNYKEWMGQTALDEDDNKVGTIDQLYVDGDTNEPTWATIKSGLFGTKTHFAPLTLAKPVEGGVRFNTTTEAIHEAPGIENDGELSPEDQTMLFNHYRQQQAGSVDDEDADDADTTVGHETSGPTTDDAMTRSEEELGVTKRRQETGRIRLHKYIVTENVQMTVPVSHEEVRVVREPITDANIGADADGPDLSEEEHEVILTQEVPVITKTTVPKERVRLGKEVVTENQDINEEVRKEQIGVEGDAAER